MKKIIYVPGKNPKPPAELHRQQLLRCLLRGVRRVNTEIADEIAASECFTLIAWNRQFYQAERDINHIIPWVDRLVSLEDYPESDRQAFRTIRYRLAHALYQLGDSLPWLIPALPDERIRSSIQDSTLYFSNSNNIASRVREIQKQPLREAASRDDKVLLIGHSMGSIIAYDSLWELYHQEDAALR